MSLIFAFLVLATSAQYNPHFDNSLRYSKHRRNDLGTCDWVPKEGSEGIYCSFCPNTPKAVITRWTRESAFSEAMKHCCNVLKYPNFIMCQLYPSNRLTPSCHSNACWRPSHHWIEPQLVAFLFFDLWVLYELALSLDSQWPFFLNGRMPYLTRLVMLFKFGFCGLLLFSSFISSGIHWSIVSLLGFSGLLDLVTFRDGLNPMMGYVLRQLPPLLGMLYWLLVFLKVHEYHTTVISTFIFSLLSYIGGAYVIFGTVEVFLISFASKVSALEHEEFESAQNVFWATSMMIGVKLACLFAIACSMMRLHTLRNNPVYDWNDKHNERGELRVWFSWTLVSFAFIFAWITYFRLLVGQKLKGRYDDYTPVGFAAEDEVTPAMDMDAVAAGRKGYGTA